MINRVKPETPLDEILPLMERDGYVLMENALPSERLGRLQEAYCRQLEAHPREEGVRIQRLKRAVERGPEFEDLMDWRPTFRVARAVIGADIELSDGGQLDYKYAHTPAHIGWHNDFKWMVNVPYPRQNFWIRCTYFIRDVTEDMGPFTLLPGSHNAEGVCPDDYNDRETRQPTAIPGQLAMTGRAGSCLINNTEIQHTNTPNRSDRDRALIMICYKHAWMKQWQDGNELSAEFAKRQTEPIRRQLCGLMTWHQGEEHFPARNAAAL